MASSSSSNTSSKPSIGAISAIIGGIIAAGSVGYLATKAYTKKKSTQTTAAAVANATSSTPSSTETKTPNPFADVSRDAGLLKQTLNEGEFIELLEEFMSYAERLQNAPPLLVPQEDLVVDAIIRYLKPYTEPAGPLKVRKFTYKTGRSNLIVDYPGSTHKVVSFVGAHMDVVAADRLEWKRDPFKLVVEGDKLWGRGVTDCLGHVAVLACMFKQLAILKPVLKVGIAGVFIANEENSTISGVGIDMLAEHGELDYLKHAPLFWIDSANFGPTIGTGGRLEWQLTGVGKKFHSGFPLQGINGIELASEALKIVQKRFYEDFPLKKEEMTKYKFEVGSSLKATQIHTPLGSTNAIPSHCTITGDIRFTPLNPTETIKSKVEQYVKEIDVTKLPSANYSRFAIPEENTIGKLELKWVGDASRGVACDLESPGYYAICEAIQSVRGSCTPFSLTGTLPLIAELRDEGFDVQVTGFGRMEAYHAVDEFSHLSEYAEGYRVLFRIIASLDATIGVKAASEPRPVLPPRRQPPAPVASAHPGNI